MNPTSTATTTDTTSTPAATASTARRRFARTALVGLAGLAGLATVAGTTGTAHASPACTGSVIHVSHDHQQVEGTCGADTIFIGPYDHVTVHAGDGDDDVRGGSGFHTHNVIYLGAGNDHYSVSENSNHVFGEGGNDTLVGGYGNDVFDGGSGDDQLTGGKGADVLFGNTGNDKMWSDDYGTDQKPDEIMGGGGYDVDYRAAMDQVHPDVEKDYITY